MSYTELTVYPKGIECTVLVEGHIATGGSNSYGSDEPEWCEVEDLTLSRVDGSALPARTKALILKEYEDHAATALVESEE